MSGQSGLRNPSAAVRGVGAGALVMELIVLLLAIVPLVKLHAGAAAAGAGVFAVLCGVLAGLLRFRWAWYAGIALQLALIVAGVLHVALVVLGIIFGGVWAYVLNVRRRVLGAGG
jgi:hypothetical protein